MGGQDERQWWTLPGNTIRSGPPVMAKLVCKFVKPMNSIVIGVYSYRSIVCIVGL